MKTINQSRRRFLSLRELAYRNEAHFSHIARIGPACFATRDIVCQSCGDSCPEAAIGFRPRAGAPPLPAVAEDRCSGCGTCIAACPAGAIACLPRGNEARYA